MKDLHPDAQRVLDLAHEERTPSAADKSRIEARLALSLGAAALASGAVASTAGSAAAQGALSNLGAKPAAAALKLWLAGSALIAVVTAGYVMTRAPSEDKPVAPIAAQVPEVAPQPVAQVELARQVEPTLRNEAVEQAPARAHKNVKAKHRDTPSTLAAELELLHSAQAAWRARDARQALAFVKSHRARYPRSALALERDAIQVLSLCELGQKQEASALGRSWLERAEHSPLRASIEQSCALR
jgi:hypothetical protein